ncbi:SEC14-like protein 3 like protein [Argiope bruennichi]|uniref:SEC14-like protein 3 like protein n=1 Tax=Argiope bruennichi TaxID=94029 RepID=A0A8T0FNX1_ARGBR|nr:SEC14-like protein 3 like protein [Argiope bruennichi]
MDNMTCEEKKVVEELKARTINDLSPKMLEDVSLFYRFAKARNFNLEQAEAMLRKFMIKYVPLSFACYDKDGCAVLVHDLGRADAKVLQIIIHIMKTFLDNYPEYLHTITIINAPAYFTWLFAILKPILPITVIQKIRIYGTGAI